MQRYLPWTEDELIREIAALKRLIDKPLDPDKPSTHCARSFLKQVLADKRAVLAAVRYSKACGETSPPSLQHFETRSGRGLH